MLAEVVSGVLVGVRCVLVRVEVSVAEGLPSISVVGLPQCAVREGKDRVRAALQASGYGLPYRRITVNLAPADLRKEGSGFDLPIAMGLLAGAGHIPCEALDGWAFVGELGLNGELRAVRGALAVAAACGEGGIRDLVVPAANAREAAAGAGGVRVLGAGSLDQVIGHLRGTVRIPTVRIEVEAILSSMAQDDPDLAEVRGQVGAKRALELAAAGGHNLLMAGPPGSGKTMLARRLSGILPPLTPEEAMEVTTIHSVAGLLPAEEALVLRRPFRAPHHTVSRAGLSGGGSPVRPGEVSLAHHGVLFLDELPEFSRGVLETLRQPVEDGWISVVRVRERLRFPARFTLVAAMNPCPCGHLGDPRKACTCDPTQVVRYRSRISGPLMDRIDLRVEVPIVPYRELAGRPTGETSEVVRERVRCAREAQWDRWVAGLRRRPSAGERGSARPGPRSDGTGSDEVRSESTCWNSALPPAGVQRWCRPDREGDRLLEDAADRMGLSARGVHRVLKVARTIADLAGEERVGEEHVAEALQYRGY